MNNNLTMKQKQVLNVIKTFVLDKGFSPTVREIGEILGEKTPGAVQGIIDRLVKKGVINREIGLARSITLVDEDKRFIKSIYIPELKRIDLRNNSNLFDDYNIEKFYPFPEESLNKINGKFFILDSNKILTEELLTDNNILDNSKLIFTDSKTMDSDCEVVLILHKQENYKNILSLRRYMSEGETTIGYSGNSPMIEQNLFKKDDIIFIGKLINSFRKEYIGYDL